MREYQYDDVKPNVLVEEQLGKAGRMAFGLGSGGSWSHVAIL